MNIKTYLTCALFAASSSMAFAGDQECPTDMVNFWKNFAYKMESHDAVPKFLLDNGCFRGKNTTDFHVFMTERFDQPEKPELVDNLYMQLSWTNGYTY